MDTRTYELKVCAFDGCERHAVSKGWCAAHYTQWRTGKDMKPVVDRRSFQTEKRCPKCDTVKPREAFYVRKNGRLQSHCIDCMIAASQERTRKIRQAMALMNRLDSA